MKKTEVAIIRASCLIFFMLVSYLSSGKEVSIFEAVKKEQVNLNLLSRGGYSEKCVSVRLRNRGSSRITVVMEPGTLLDNLDEAQQDIIVVRTLKVDLAPFQMIDTAAYGNCCQSRNAIPKKGQRFALARMADSTLVALCKFIERRRIPDYTAQHAIWTISNGHNLASIGVPTDTALAGLFAICTNGNTIPRPWYHIGYRKIPGIVFSNEVCRVVLNFDYMKKSDKNLTIAVYDDCGRKVKTLLSNSYAVPGNKNFHFDFEIVNWPSGKYTLKVNEWEQEPFSKTFEI
ncbi:MAG: hypothetical protein ACK5P4_01050 [Bacteroidota bacterium]